MGPWPVRTSSTPRLKDIADKTGFSTNTVSLALRESPRIPAETRDVIRRAATELNYQPNHVARSLVSRETKTIGLILTDIMNPTLTETAQQVELALAERGYGTLFATSNHSLERGAAACRDVPLAPRRRAPHLPRGARPARSSQGAPPPLPGGPPHRRARRRYRCGERRRPQRRPPRGEASHRPRPQAHRPPQPAGPDQQQRKVRGLSARARRGRHRPSIPSSSSPPAATTRPTATTRSTT